MNNLETLTIKYFTYWKSKNLQKLSKLFDDEIVLQDWENLIIGKEALIKFNQDFFEIFDKIYLDIIFINYFKNTSFSELKIKIDDLELVVFEKITFNEKNLITNIRAFKG
tara:strand:+ start:377 stop:706 length:330 start_codon:yes stop_codon:yes gene_type:complete